MKTLVNILIMLVALAGGVAAGFRLGFRPSAHPLQETAAPTPRAKPERLSATPDAPRPSAGTEGVRTTGTRPPGERLAEIAAMDPYPRGAYMAEQLFAGLTLAELPAALDRIMKLPQGARWHMLNACFTRWGERDGPGAVAAAEQLSARERMGAQAQAFVGWAKVDPFGAWGAAREVIEANPNAGWRVSGVLRELARVDLSRAMNEALALSSDRTRISARHAVISAAADDDRLQTAFQAAVSIEDAVQREAWTKDIFQRWGTTDLDGPLQALRSLGDQNLGQSAMNGLLLGWAELDPNGAVDYALANRADPLVEGALGQLLQTAVRQISAADARAMMNEVVEAGALDLVAGDTFFSLAQSHPELAVSLIGNLTSEQDRRRYLSTSLSTWSRNDFAAAASYFEQMPYDAGKRSAFVNMSQRALESDGGAERVVRWLESFPEPDRRSSVTRLLGMLELNSVRLRPGAAGVLASAVTNTPGLPDEARAHAQKLFGASPGP